MSVHYGVLRQAASAMSRSPITTHVLDTARGCPASNVKICIEQLQSGSFKVSGSLATDLIPQVLSEKCTNSDGRIADLLPPGSLQIGMYKMTFYTKDYYQAIGMECFYPEVSVMFEIKSIAEHYHVPLLVSPYGYSTYRGS